MPGADVWMYGDSSPWSFVAVLGTILFMWVAYKIATRTKK